MEIQKILTVLKPQICQLALILLLFVTSGCAIAKIDGHYAGKVIDAVTGQPIEGAVAHGDWYREYMGAGGTSHSYADSVETLTDNNGEFKIPGLGFLMFTYIGEMNITIFKAGYEQVRPTRWSWCMDSSGGCRNSSGPMTIKQDGNKILFKLRRLTNDERYGRRVDMSIAPNKKQKLLITEFNREHKEIGRSYSILPVE